MTYSEKWQQIKKVQTIDGVLSCIECGRGLRFNSGSPAVYHEDSCSLGPTPTYMFGQDMLEIAELEKPSGNEFWAFVDRAVYTINMDQTEIASALRVSKPTLTRWLTGESAPHPVARKPVMDTLMELLEKQL